MSFFSKFLDFIAPLEDDNTFAQEAVTGILSDGCTDSGAEIAVYNQALQSACRLISGAISKCEIRTYDSGKHVKGEEYYCWNYAPNRNQNTSEFFGQIVRDLIYRGECLVISTSDGQLLIADTWIRKSYMMYDDIFSDVTIVGADGSSYRLDRTFRASEVLYYRLDGAGISGIIAHLSGMYTDLLETAAKKYRMTGGQKGVLKIAGNAPTKTYGTKRVTQDDGTIATVPKTFADVYTEMVGKSFSDYFRKPDAVLPLFDGFDYIEKSSESGRKSGSELGDLVKITDEIYAKVAQAIGIPVILLRGDTASIDAVTDNFVSFCIDPIAKMIERENNRKRNGDKVLSGTYQVIDTSRIRHQDAFAAASSVDKLLSSGMYSIDELREKSGDAPLNTDWSKQHYLTKNYAGITSAQEDTHDNKD